MAVNLHAPDPNSLSAVAGIELGCAEAGIRKPNRKDLLVVRIAEGAHVAGVFTQNRFAAAPVLVCREHLAAQRGVRALLVNTGNANAGTGESGLAAARASCTAVAQLLGCDAKQVLPFSTGVIMEPLPVDRLIAGLPQAVSDLSGNHWLQAAQAIMTTDTVPKAASRRTEIAGASVTLTGIAKGAGMIRPDMATMLGFIATDAAVAPAVLQTPDAAGGRSVVQFHHDRRRHIDQRFVCRHRNRARVVANRVGKRAVGGGLFRGTESTSHASLRMRLCATAKERPSSSKYASNRRPPKTKLAR